MTTDSETERAFSPPHENRRSGLLDRRNDSSVAQFRQEIDREYRAEIRQLRDEDNKKDLQLVELKADVMTLQAWQKDKEETLTAAKMIVHAGIALKTVVIVLIAVTAAIGGIAVSLEAFRSWFK